MVDIEQNVLRDCRELDSSRRQRSAAPTGLSAYRRMAERYTDGVRSSTRPARLMDDRSAAMSPPFRFVLISGQVHRGVPRIRVAREDLGFAMTGLLRESLVYVADAQAIVGANVLERLGVLPGYVAHAVEAKLHEVRRGRAP